MSLALFIARRLSLRSASGKLSSGLAIAVTGIALSVIVMLISISVMLGFKQEIRQKIMGFDAQLTVTPRHSANDSVAPLVSMSELGSTLAYLPEGVRPSLMIRLPVLLKSASAFTGVAIKGVSENYNWTFLREHLVEGEIPVYSADSTFYHILVSTSFARDLKLNVGDKLDAFFFGDNVYRTRRLKVAGLFNTHFSEYDSNYVFANIDMLADVADIPPGYGSHLEIYGLEDDEEIKECADHITSHLMDEIYTGKISTLYKVTDVHATAAIYFNWLSLLDTNVVVILTLMSLLSCLTLISSLFIMILRRVNMIGILKALGATDGLIRRAFVYLTMRILCFGLLIGNVIGIGLIVLQKITGVMPLNPDAYYLDHVPVVLSVPSLFLLNAGIIIVSVIVLILPSAIITSIPPSRVIKYE